MSLRVYILDLIDDPDSIAQDARWHTEVWPEVLEYLASSGIKSCRISRAGNRLVMLVESETPVATDGGGSPVPPPPALRFRRRI